jgi:hypothetical protein
MNFPNSVVRHVFATVVLIFRSMAYIPERFADHCNDSAGRFIVRADEVLTAFWELEAATRAASS